MARLLRTRAILLVVVAAFVLPLTARDAASAQLIRDTEIENTIRAYATPLFDVAGLEGSDVRIFIISDDTLNAFVAGGMNLFINTGLLLRSKSANQLIGVIAHETGHIAGGHLVRFSDRIKTGSTAALVATILGALTAYATGSGEAGAAVAIGGQGLAVGSILSYSRTQESAADQAALRFLDQTGQSARGLRQFFETIEDQELLPPGQQDEYVQTHPITRRRIQDVDAHLARSPYSDAPTDPRFEESYARMMAKLRAFLQPPARTLSAYGEDDRSVAGRYARAIAYYRQNDLDRALPILQRLIAQEPDNPYFHEVKGQALLEAGRIAEALAPYGEAARLAPDAPLIRIDLARTQLAANDPKLVKAALKNLLFATRESPENAFGWHQLAIAYGRDGQLGMSTLALAEEALIKGKLRDAAYQVARAERHFSQGSAGWIRAQDLKREIRSRREKRER